jgi:hypothetical protein
MRPVVRAAVEAFQTKYEGKLPFPYCDELGLVTTAIGNLIDPVSLAIGLPWQISGATATELQIVSGWQAVKARQDLKGQGGGAYANVCPLRLTEEAIHALFLAETDRMWGQILAAYPDAEEWPASSQLGTLSMVWAMGMGHLEPGPAFDFPHWRAAALAQDWPTCAAQCAMQGVGIAKRNTENVALFKAASTSNPDTLPS